MKKIILILLFSLALVACDHSEDNIKKEIEKANYCETKDDCIDVGGKCPFGCYVYVNENEADRIKGLVDSYESDCVYGCMACFDVECRDNRCEPVCE
ncbi:MAG: hypothetical protein R6V53_06070 [Candidatus Woesearchaeota archaeon]